MTSQGLSPALQSDYDSATHRVSWFRLGPRTEISITGRDRLRVMNNFCTADLRQIPPGQGAEAFVLNFKGTVLGHIACYVTADSIQISSVADQSRDLIEHFQRFVVSESVEFIDNSTRKSILIVGPDAGKSLQQLRENLSDLRRMEHGALDLKSGVVQVRRTDLIGADGFEFVAEPHSLQPIEEWAAREIGSAGSLEVLEVLRVENRIPYYGIDIDAKNLPQEIGRDSWAISFTKGCYLGQETVARLDSLGHVNRHWVPLGFSESIVPPAGAIVEYEGKPIARITSATFSPQRSSPIALAYVRHGFHQSGQAFPTPWGDAVVVK